MAKPFAALPAILKQREVEFLDGVDKIAREAALAAGQAAVLHTRVDTGQARSNWQASRNTPTDQVVPPYAPGQKLGIGERANALGVMNQHRSVIEGWPSTRGVVLYFSNNVPYIGILNSGGPTVAAGNMIAFARQAWAESIKKPRKILR